MTPPPTAPILSYSRGRGYGYRGRGVRGGGGRGRGGRGSDFSRGLHHQHHRYQRQKPPHNNNNNNRWVRSHPTTASQNSKNNEEKDDSLKKEGGNRSPQLQTEEEEDDGSNIQNGSERKEPQERNDHRHHIVNVMTKVGRNRLVLKNETVDCNSVAASRKFFWEQSEMNREGGEKAADDGDTRSDFELKNGQDSPSLPPSTSTSTSPSGDNDQQEQNNDQKTSSLASSSSTMTMMKTSGNKLVSIHLATSLSSKPTSKAKANHQSRPINPRNRKSKKTTKRLKPPPPPPVAKRIKLIVQEDSYGHHPGDDQDLNGNECEDDDDTKNIDLSKEETAETQLSASKERLLVPQGNNPKAMSDFAYRHTSRIWQRRQSSSHLQWTKNDANSTGTVTAGESRPTNHDQNNLDRELQQQQHRNMGLVRVRQDKRTTPVCPTFLRGLPCEDPYCRKRHDISKEHTMPVCSFFQRQGQCLRGVDCPFQHVKINPLAMVCPSFNILGFCEDSDCKMHHVRSSSSRRRVATQNNKSKNDHFRTNKRA